MSARVTHRSRRARVAAALQRPERMRAAAERLRRALQAHADRTLVVNTDCRARAKEGGCVSRRCDPDDHQTCRFAVDSLVVRVWQPPRHPNALYVLSEKRGAVFYPFARKERNRCTHAFLRRLYDAYGEPEIELCALWV